MAALKYYVKNGDLVLYKYTLPEDKHEIIYRGLGYIDEWNVDGTGWLCKISVISNDIEYDRTEVFYKSSIVKNFGAITFEKFKEDFPEWII